MLTTQKKQTKRYDSVAQERFIKFMSERVSSKSSIDQIVSIENGNIPPLDQVMTDIRGKMDQLNETIHFADAAISKGAMKEHALERLAGRAAEAENDLSELKAIWEICGGSTIEAIERALADTDNIREWARAKKAIEPAKRAFYNNLKIYLGADKDGSYNDLSTYYNTKDIPTLDQEKEKPGLGHNSDTTQVVTGNPAGPRQGGSTEGTGSDTKELQAQQEALDALLEKLLDKGILAELEGLYDNDEDEDAFADMVENEITEFLKNNPELNLTVDGVISLLENKYKPIAAELSMISYEAVALAAEARIAKISTKEELLQRYSNQIEALLAKLPLINKYFTREHISNIVLEELLAGIAADDEIRTLAKANKEFKQREDQYNKSQKKIEELVLAAFHEGRTYQSPDDVLGNLTQEITDFLQTVPMVAQTPDVFAQRITAEYKRVEAAIALEKVVYEQRIDTLVAKALAEDVPAEAGEVVSKFGTEIADLLATCPHLVSYKNYGDLSVASAIANKIYEKITNAPQEYLILRNKIIKEILDNNVAYDVIRSYVTQNYATELGVLLKKTQPDLSVTDVIDAIVKELHEDDPDVTADATQSTPSSAPPQQPSGDNYKKDWSSDAWGRFMAGYRDTVPNEGESVVNAYSTDHPVFGWMAEDQPVATDKKGHNKAEKAYWWLTDKVIARTEPKKANATKESKIKKHINKAKAAVKPRVDKAKQSVQERRRHNKAVRQAQADVASRDARRMANGNATVGSSDPTDFDAIIRGN